MANRAKNAASSSMSGVSLTNTCWLLRAGSRSLIDLYPRCVGRTLAGTPLIRQVKFSQLSVSNAALLKGVLVAVREQIPAVLLRWYGICPSLILSPDVRNLRGHYFAR